MTQIYLKSFKLGQKRAKDLHSAVEKAYSQDELILGKNRFNITKPLQIHQDLYFYGEHSDNTQVTVEQGVEGFYLSETVDLELHKTTYFREAHSIILHATHGYEGLLKIAHCQFKKAGLMKYMATDFQPSIIYQGSGRIEIKHSYIDQLYIDAPDAEVHIVNSTIGSFEASSKIHAKSIVIEDSTLDWVEFNAKEPLQFLNNTTHGGLSFFSDVYIEKLRLVPTRGLPADMVTYLMFADSSIEINGIDNKKEDPAYQIYTASNCDLHLYKGYIQGHEHPNQYRNSQIHIDPTHYRDPNPWVDVETGQTMESRPQKESLLDEIPKN